MTLTVTKREGIASPPTLAAVASKSAAHRLLILAALANKKSSTHIVCREINEDITATADCLCALGARITRTGDGFSVYALDRAAQRTEPCRLDAGESGSTLRFLLPILGMLGIEGDIVRRGKLPARPLSPLDALLGAHGMTITSDPDDPAVLHVRGNLQGGGAPYAISGGVSSQNITGLLMALALSGEEAVLLVEGELSSAPYVDMTLDALSLCGVTYTCEMCEGGRIYRKPRADLLPPESLRVEGDFSSAAAMLCAGVLSGAGVRMTGLDLAKSRQGDKAIALLLCEMGATVTEDATGIAVYPPQNGRLQPIDVSAEHTPDLVPVLAVLCGAACGKSVIRDCARLRIKESDRLSGTEALLLSLGVACYIDGDDLHIFGIFSDVKRTQIQTEETHTPPPVGDHRMVMAAALGALYTRGGVRVQMAESVGKSYPRFFDDLAAFCKITPTESEDKDKCQAPTQAN